MPEYVRCRSSAANTSYLVALDVNNNLNDRILEHKQFPSTPSGRQNRTVIEQRLQATNYLVTFIYAHYNYTLYDLAMFRVLEEWLVTIFSNNPSTWCWNRNENEANCELTRAKVSQRKAMWATVIQATILKAEKPLIGCVKNNDNSWKVYFINLSTFSS